LTACLHRLCLRRWDETTVARMLACIVGAYETA
jgi:hypothetical protein